MKLASLALVVAVAACGSATPKPAPPPPPVDGALLPWLVGDHAAAKGQLAFVEHRGAKYGVWLGDDGGARVWIFDQISADDPRPRVWAVRLAPGAATTVTELSLLDAGASTASFASADRAATLSLRADAGGSLAGADAPGLAWDRSTPLPPAEAGEIAALEGLFYKDSVDRGGAAWAAWFASDGSELNDAGLVQGNAAVGEAMTPVLAAVKLDWAPITTRVHGDVAFAVGGFSITDRKTANLAGTGSYVTVWRNDSKLGWKVWFDGGRPE